MLVYKFGGASVKDASGIRNLAAILSDVGHEDVFCVVSAMGKTTNALEQLAQRAWEGLECGEQVLRLEEAHFSTANQLGLAGNSKKKLVGVVEELKKSLQQDRTGHFFARFQDEIVAYGELLSTTLVAGFLEHTSIPVSWGDARQLIRTEGPFTRAGINWQDTELALREWASSIRGRVGVIQGFIGANAAGQTTTLGREGSDFTASILASCLGADSVTIWKDVPGVLTADPRIHPHAQKFNKLSYHDAAEMTYYGAVVIHPKTIHPLVKAQIPLYVKPFMNPTAKGTLISAEEGESLPTYIYKFNQFLASFGTRDSSFIHELHLGQIMKELAAAHIHVNLMQISATSVSLIFDYREDQWKAIQQKLEPFYTIRYNEGLHLLTVKNHPPLSDKELVKSGEVLISQRTRTTLQILYRPGT